MVLNLDERIGSPVRMIEVSEFRECVAQCRVVDIKQAGRYFTWTNKQEGENHVFSKLDRVMANAEWYLGMRMLSSLSSLKESMTIALVFYVFIKRWRVKDLLGSLTCG